jgi:hypothetical protein
VLGGSLLFLVIIAKCLENPNRLRFKLNALFLVAESQPSSSTSPALNPWNS